MGDLAVAHLQLFLTMFRTLPSLILSSFVILRIGRSGFHWIQQSIFCIFAGVEEVVGRPIQGQSAVFLVPVKPFMAL